MVLPTDCVRIILDMLHPTKVAQIDTIQAKCSRVIINNATTVIQRWYRSRKLSGDTPYHHTTLHTMLRFYVTRQNVDFLKSFPVFAITKLSLTGEYTEKYRNPTLEMKKCVVRTFYQFCKDSSLSLQDLNYIGW